jgi:hypothetical protein
LLPSGIGVILVRAASGAYSISDGIPHRAIANLLRLRHGTHMNNSCAAIKPPRGGREE